MKTTLHKIISALLMVILVLTSLSSAIGETTIYLLGAGKTSKSYQMFSQAHPELTVEFESNIFLSTNEMITAMLTGEFPYDTFVLMSNSFDVKQMLTKGYCAEITDSSVVPQELGKMYKPIEQMLTLDGNIHGVPFDFHMGYYSYDPVAWAAAGLGEEDVPRSFEELLDFLEAWMERIKDSPEDEIFICSTFDEELYGEHSYINYLVDKLVTNHIMQCNYANEPIRFDTPIFRAMMERCQKIGTDLYAIEPEQKSGLGLFYEWHGMRGLTYLVPLRLTVDQPILIPSTLYAVFVNALSQHQALAMDYLEACLACIEPESGAYLYRDAEPVEQEGYSRSMDAVQAEIDALEQRATNSELDPLEKNTLQDQITEKKLKWEEMSTSDERYIISPQDLELYRTYGDCLYFQPPSIFDPSTEEGQNLRQLRDGFSTGNLTVEQFISRLDEMAWILELEESK
ncbi:MAG: extracellular solute-binding protein [Clostridiales bacterium]|nr:extracellular solute-binding protein [Clostridiales bacterium]